MRTLNAPSFGNPYTPTMIDEVLQNGRWATDYAEKHDQTLVTELANKATAPLVADGTIGRGKVLESLQELPLPRRNAYEKLAGLPESFAFLQARLNRGEKDAEEIKAREKWGVPMYPNHPLLLPGMAASGLHGGGLESLAAGVGLVAASVTMDVFVVSRMQDELRPSIVKYSLGHVALGFAAMLGPTIVGAVSEASFGDPKIFCLGLAALVVGGGLAAKALFEAKGRVDRTLALGDIAKKIKKNLPESITLEILAESFKSQPMRVVSEGYAHKLFSLEYEKVCSNLQWIDRVEGRLVALRQKRVAIASDPAIPESFRDVTWIDSDLAILATLKAQLTELTGPCQAVLARLLSAKDAEMLSQSEVEYLCKAALSLMKKIQDLKTKSKLIALQKKLKLLQG